MASYINPAELLQPYLQPFMASVDKGITQGMGLVNLGLEAQKNRAMLPYYDAQAKSLLQEIADKKLKEDKLAWLLKNSGQLNDLAAGQTMSYGQSGPKIPEIGAPTAEELKAMVMTPSAIDQIAQRNLYLASLGMDKLLPSREINKETGEVITIDPLTQRSFAGPIPGLTIPKKFEKAVTMSPEGVPVEQQVLFDATGNVQAIPGLPSVPRQNPMVIMGQGGNPLFGFPKEGTLAIDPRKDNMIDLATRAMGGDQEAQAILDKLQGMKVDVATAGGKGRAEGFGEIRTITVIDNLDPNPVTRVKTLNINDFNKLNDAEPGRYVQASQSIPHIEEKKEIGVRVGPRSTNIQTAYGVFKKESPELISLREKVQKKGLFPGEDILKDIGAINQWLGKKTTDPDVAELQKKTKLLADTLQRTIGGTQGGQWAFEVAADILDPTYSTQAFTRIMSSHEKTMERMAEEYKNFGKEISVLPPAQTTDTLQPNIPVGAIGHGLDPETGELVYFNENGEVIQ